MKRGLKQHKCTFDWRYPLVGVVALEVLTGMVLALSLVRMKFLIFSNLYTINPGKTLGFKTAAGS